MELKLFNTLGREMQRFVPLSPGKAGLYTCGPTVYSFAHIGNFRTYIFEDVLRKTLQYFGFEVAHVMNVTDVGHLTDDADEGEDKILKSAREKGKTVWEIADYYTAAFFRDFGLLRCAAPTVVCKATDHVQDMIDLIRRIETNGYTYLSGGNLYFDVGKFDGYGRLALLDQQTLRAGARIAVDSGKKNPADFALWFTKSKFEHQTMLWDSPWGRGYPGWHIECSAMSMKYLGEQFDIHCGGIDHIPVHHTNEIAQAEAATGKKWVNYWLHGEFLLMDKAKMAKSTSFITLQTIMDKGYDPLDYRYLCLGAHYRTNLGFGYEGLDAARASRLGLMEKIARLKEETGGMPASPRGKAREYLDLFEAHAAEDLNMPKCLADLWMLLRDSSVEAPLKLGAALEMDKILDIDLAGTAEHQTELDDEARSLIEEREEARRRRDWKRADEIRDLLKGRGITLQDDGKGTKVRIAAGKRGEKTVTSHGNSC